MVTLERFEKGYLELFHAPRLIEGYTAKVITDACFLILEEIPCEEYRVNIDGYNEVLNLGDIQEENDYFVDYTNCIVYFHGSKMGKNITITDYWGMGLNFIGANRIITRISADGRIIETLDDVISAYPDLLNKLQEAREKIVIIQGLLDRIVPTQNPDFTVGKTNWVEFTQNGQTFYKYTLTHNLHSRNLIVSMMNLDTNMNMPSPAFSYDNENKITVYSVERINAKYVICSKYYYGAENLNSEIIQEVRDSRFGKGSLNQKIAEMCTFMDNINTTLTKKVDGIQIGTRNYLLNTALKDDTSNFVELNNEVTRVTTMKTPNGNNCFYTKLSNKTSNVWRGATQEVTSGFSIGDTMTFSVWTYVTNEVATDEGLFVEVVGVASDNSTRTFVINKQVNTSNVNKWVKYDLTFVVPNNTVKIKCLSYVVRNGSWYVGDYKLEKGNKITDWSPNPKDIDNKITTTKTELEQLISDTALATKKALHPVNSIYLSMDSTNPNTLFGFGTWQLIGQGRTLVGVDTIDADFNTAGKTGGSKTHTMTVQELVPHVHAQIITNGGGGGINGRADYVEDGNSLNAYPQGVNTDSTGGGQAFSIMQPYVTVYIWKRIA